jgi:hypothetical protein
MSSRRADLDSAYAEFKNPHCDTRSDKTPRPSDWQYSPEWQQEENIRRASFMAEFARRTLGF